MPDDVSHFRDKIDKSPEAALLLELLAYLEENPRDWWEPGLTRASWGTLDRLEALRAQPELRARITHDLTGLALGAAMGADPVLQADLVDRVVESGEVSLADWEAAFPRELLVVEGPRSALWQEFRTRYPWESPSSEDRTLLVWLLERLLEPRGEDETAIMTPLYVRSAIDVRVWQEKIPIDIRVQVDGQRLRRELEGKPFTCRDELAVVRLERMVKHIPVAQVKGVFDALERVLPGLAMPTTQIDDEEVESTEALGRRSTPQP
ncbi:MAG: hypothetical protein KTR31_20850 [Myxococcales bacterium]|nr:hypothetical protein [Myxococcales bacterium]